MKTMTLKQWMSNLGYLYGGTTKAEKARWDWAKDLLNQSYQAGKNFGKKQEFTRLRKQAEDFRRSCHGHRDGVGFVVQEVENAVFGKDEKGPGQCEHPWCPNKATWCVCASNGRGVDLCGRHKTGKWLTLDMRRIKRAK